MRRKFQYMQVHMYDSQLELHDYPFYLENLFNNLGKLLLLSQNVGPRVLLGECVAMLQDHWIFKTLVAAIYRFDG